MRYLELSFELEPLLPAKDILIAELGDAGFESFVETKSGVKAYIPLPDFKEEMLDDLFVSAMPDVKVEMSRTEIAEENWNAKWEAQFEPIFIDSRCVIRATFHKDLAPVDMEVIINPKMSFGTGHHATTYLMTEALLDMDLTGKSVLDMGCGTGVLAIVAAKKGSRDVDAIDIDPWSVENSLENIALNNCDHIKVYPGGAESIKGEYDLILANINRNILTRDMPVYVDALYSSGQICFSGFFQSDEAFIQKRAEELGLRFLWHKTRGEWAMMVFEKPTV